MNQATIKFTDGKERILRYSLGTYKRASKALGMSLLKDGIGTLDEESFGSLFWHGLCDATGKPPEDLPNPESLDDLIDMAQFATLMVKFSTVGMNAKRKEAPPTREEGDPVTVVFKDGVERTLRYSLATSKKIARQFGNSLMKTGLKDIDEAKFGVILWNGLRDATGKPPVDLPTAESLDELIEMAEFWPLWRAFNDAWILANAAKNAKGDQDSQAEPQAAAAQN